LPGVVVFEQDGPRCAPLCQLVLDASAERDVDDWSKRSQLYGAFAMPVSVEASPMPGRRGR
jgi:hypothetical protein